MVDMDVATGASSLTRPAGPGTTAGTGFFQRGLGFYRKTLLESEFADDRIWPEFDGVYMNYEIYVNGRLAARSSR